MRIAVSAAILAVGLAQGVIAQAQQPSNGVTTVTATAPGKGSVERVGQITASVEVVDATSRSVTIKGPTGNIVTLTVGPEVKNFDQIRAGDFVVVRFTEALTLELNKGGTASRERTDLDMTETAGPDERPAAGGAHKVHVVADVIAVDPETQTVTLRGPTRVVQLEVQDPEQFKLVKIGDQVEATYIEAIAISVEAAL